MKESKKKNNKMNISTKSIFVGVFLISSFFFYNNIDLSDFTSVKYDDVSIDEEIEIKEPVWVATHIEIPEAVKAIYMTACAAIISDEELGITELGDF